MDLSAFADEVGALDPVTIAGTSTRGGPVPGVRQVRAPAGIEWLEADEMRVSCGAGTAVDDLQAALAEVGQRVALPEGGTVGGALSVGRSGIRLLGDGPLRNALLQTRYVSAGGVVVTAGGPTVKNVTGFDLCRLLVGARGTLGFLGDVILRTRPVSEQSRWFVRETEDPWNDLGALYRPTSILWDGTHAHVLLEGRGADVDAQARSAALRECDPPPPPSGRRRTIEPPQERQLRGEFVCLLTTGVVYDTSDQPGTPVSSAVNRLTTAIKQRFDPTGRLNPGVG